MKKLALSGMGIALFVVLSLIIQIPIFQNYYLCFGYVALTVYLYFFGVKSGIVVGTLGTLLYCIVINGLRGMPGWILGNIIISIILGFAFKLGSVFQEKYKQYSVYIIGNLLACFCGILLGKSLLECFLYSQPLFVRITSNSYAFIADLIVIYCSFPICELIQKTKILSFEEKKRERKLLRTKN